MTLQYLYEFVAFKNIGKTFVFPDQHFHAALVVLQNVVKTDSM